MWHWLISRRCSKGIVEVVFDTSFVSVWAANSCAYGESPRSKRRRHFGSESDEFWNSIKLFSAMLRSSGLWLSYSCLHSISRRMTWNVHRIVSEVETRDEQPLLNEAQQPRAKDWAIGVSSQRLHIFSPDSIRRPWWKPTLGLYQRFLSCSALGDDQCRIRNTHTVTEWACETVTDSKTITGEISDVLWSMGV